MSPQTLIIGIINNEILSLGMTVHRTPVSGKYREDVMEEKENSPVKQRKLKRIEEYLEKIPLAWRFCQREIESGSDARKAELKAVKKVYPVDKNSSSTLNIWKKYGLWPPSEEILNGIDISQANSRFQGKNGLKLIFGAGRGRRQIDELSEKDILQRVGKILDTIEVHKRERGTGGRRKIYSLTRTKIIAARIPVDLLNEIHRFRGSNSYHLERALRLYVKVMGAKD